MMNVLYFVTYINVRRNIYFRSYNDSRNTIQEKIESIMMVLATIYDWQKLYVYIYRLLNNRERNCSFM